MSSHASLSTRARALSLLLEGRPVAEVAARVERTDSMVYSWARMAGMRFEKGRSGGVKRADPVPAGEGHGRRLSLADRARIEAGLELGMKVAQIAVMIGVHRSTVYREIARGSLVYRSERLYHAGASEHRAASARSRPKARVLDENPRLQAAVITGLNEKRSPQQVASRLRVKFAHDQKMQVSHESIYQALYVQGKGALRHELTVEKALRSGRTGRIPRSKLPAAANRPWLAGARLSDRPAVVEDRAVPGHWEGDLVIGPHNSGLITLVERSSRFALIDRLPGARDSATVISRLQTMIEGLPAALKASLTWDQGSEMAQHAKFTVATGCPVYFCDPHSPWQRGSNENLNGLIRDFYPKGTNFNTVTDADIAEMQRLLNDRPRMTLEWLKPCEKLDEYIKAVALTP